MPPAGEKAQRTCLGCRRVLDQNLLVRYVLSPDGEIRVDYRQKLPGRGAYTCLDRNCLSAAVKNRQFARAFKGAAGKTSAEELLKSLGNRILERALSLLAMARKCGDAVSGSSLVLNAMNDNAGQFALIVLAEDISEGIAEKVLGKAAAAGTPCFRLAEKETLGRILGKEERSVIALKKGRLAENLKIELLRYEYLAGES